MEDHGVERDDVWGYEMFWNDMWLEEITHVRPSIDTNTLRMIFRLAFWHKARLVDQAC